MGVVTKTVDLGTAQQAELRIVTGTVIGSDQRSETHISGGGAILNSNGGAVVRAVRSEVEVVRDIWIREEDGAEHHVQLNADVPVRTGHIIRYVELHFEGRLKDRLVSIPYRLVNVSTAKWHDLAGNDFLEDSMALRVSRMIGIWGFFFGGILAWPFMIFFALRDMATQKRQREKLSEVCSATTPNLPVPTPAAVVPAAS